MVFQFETHRVVFILLNLVNIVLFSIKVACVCVFFLHTALLHYHLLTLPSSTAFSFLARVSLLLLFLLKLEKYSEYHCSFTLKLHSFFKYSIWIYNALSERGKFDYWHNSVHFACACVRVYVVLETIESDSNIYVKYNHCWTCRYFFSLLFAISL